MQNEVAKANDRATAAPTTREVRDVHLQPLAIAAFIAWLAITVNSLLDPIKTLYGYYIYMDSYNQYVVWQLTIENTFNNISSKICSPNGPFLDCYFELPVYGTGSLAGATCRSYYPIDKAPTQHVGNFFGNCTLPSGERIDIPDGVRFVSTQWSATALRATLTPQ
ncbi:hypothetical protein SDRG_06176 [Saprolegnia diclina VS20]|uniref:Uncharacterized protein n=1 Tax=Saprolegnia diclina (strain VS20) TaxID=1156394 RepID=T0QRX3_SAPDV|nr:hypothetical protein SDRG_06176 [Saprolegnia diclina VS20]EQC36740.1 hypothetical protein SDRG_06176 [Saprolegnia diclina VS20]|eukprot:XP_008610161.1 hypothetical protein SDRG_06176 [Saprolegnia diclina VS20]